MGHLKTKVKAKKVDGHTSQKHLHARISYLYQAAAYMQSLVDGHPSHLLDPKIQEAVGKATLQRLRDKSTVHDKPITERTTLLNPPSSILESRQGHNALHLRDLGQAHRFVTHLRAVSLKSQIRLSPTMKHSICKRCDSLLVAGSTSTSEMENQSRGGKKPWADVLVVTCNICGSKKRFPVGAKRQPRRTVRDNLSKDDSNAESAGSKHEASLDVHS